MGFLQESHHFFTLSNNYKNSSQIDLGTEWRKSYFILGGKIRYINNKNQEYIKTSADAFIFNIGFRVSNFDLLYSYDFLLSELSNAGLSANEVSLKYLFKK